MNGFIIVALTPSFDFSLFPCVDTSSSSGIQALLLPPLQLHSIVSSMAIMQLKGIRSEGQE